MVSPDPQRAFAESVVRQLKDAGFIALWAGGCVRDHLLGKTPKDYDVATSARPEQVREVFGNRRTLSVGESFGVIVVLPPNREAGQVEVATFRTDGCYVDGRRPESVAFSTPEQDAQRRDFTINGMFYDPTEQRVLDYVGGERDLAAGIVRAIGDPQARMTEDKLRLLRAVRFAATFQFQLDPVTADAIRQMAGQLNVVSAERIAQELRRMLVDPHRERAIELCEDVGLLPEVLPELRSLVQRPDQWQLAKTMLRLLLAPNFSLAVATLFERFVELSASDSTLLLATIGERLKLSNQEVEASQWLLKHRHSLDGARELSRARLKRVLAAPLADDLLALLRVRDVADGREPTDALFCQAFLDATPADEINPATLMTGDDLKAAGFQPGPKFKVVLDAVRDAQLNGEINTTEAAIELALRLARGSERR